jgi:branched-chain amino acid transport system substrate-binding protein
MITGILLPNSTTYPLIAHNFMVGVKGALAQLAPALSPELHTATIGFGTDAGLMLQEAEIMLLDKRADVLIVFADHPVVECLFPLINAMKKLLIIVNGGAKYPPVKRQPYVIYHTLNYALNCRLTGKYAAGFSEKAVMATSYYDGGYSLCHAISKGYMDKGSAVAFNFVSKFKAEEFDIKPLSGFLIANDEISNVLAVYSDLSPVFYEKLVTEFPAARLNVFVNSAMLDDFHLPEYGVTNKEISIHAYVPWAIGIKNGEHTDYCNAFKNKTGRVPDAIGALGWDTGVLLMKHMMISLDNPLFDTRQVLDELLDLEINGAKGELYIDRKTHQVFSPAYRVRLGVDNHLVVEDKVLLEEVLQEWTEICDDPPQGYVSGWINTYMCS